MIFWHYFEISNKNERVCITIDYRNLYFISPGKYRAKANNPNTQFCYFNETKKDNNFNAFLVERIPTLNSEISFQIDNLADTSNKGEVKLFKAVIDLKDLTEKSSRNIKQQQFKRENKQYNSRNNVGRKRAKRKFFL